MQLTVAQVVEATSAVPSQLDLGQPVKGWSIDSRSIKPGEIFVALRGDSQDGHLYVSAALERGGLAALVSSAIRGPNLLVPDTLRALQQVALYARRHWARDVVCVTGSAGKTSTKDIVAELLAVRFRVGKTVGNFNNHIGLPLSILRIADDSELGVFELGMNHAGEIRDLASIAEPRIGVVTNVGYAHVEFLKSIEGIAAAKRELIEALPVNGVAVLNADDERVTKFPHAGRTIRYGFSAKADIRAELSGSSFVVNGTKFYSQMPGRHSTSNILAGIAVASAFDIPLSELVEPVASLRPSKMRGERILRNGVTILNDSYNSNPEAARQMIDCLRTEPAERRIAVLGEMLELGHMAEALHRELGVYAAAADIDLVIGVAGSSTYLVEEAKRSKEAYFFSDAETAGTFLKQIVRPGDAILFKGSRGTHVERALATMED